LMSTGSSDKEARYGVAPPAVQSVLVETSALDRKRNEKEMKRRTTRSALFLLLLSNLHWLSLLFVLCYILL